MRFASNFWVFLILSSLLFNCSSLKPEIEPEYSMQKAYILLRSEGTEKEINQLTGILNSEFHDNKIRSDVFYYPIGMPWNNNQIFSNAYDNNYDYIVLIDQVAKFTIDNRTNVGGKYQIRSYPIKSPNPDWIDLGDKTCNISVKQSVEKFCKQISSSINTDNNSLTIKKNNEDAVVYHQKPEFSEIDYNQLKTSEEIDVEIETLKTQLEIEKEKTEKANAKKKQLEEEYKEILNAQKEKNLVVLEGLKKEKELAEIKRKEKLAAESKEREEEFIKVKKLEEKRDKDKMAEQKRMEEAKLKDLEKKMLEEKIAESKRLENKQIKEAKLTEFNSREDIKLKELKKQTKSKKRLAHTKVPKEEKKELSVSVVKKKNKSNALIIIRGSQEDSTSLKNLKDNLEFELLFANIKATTEIYSQKMTLSKQDILKFNQPNYEYLILIDQLEQINKGADKYHISIVSSSYGNKWYDLEDQYFDLKDKNSLKQFSKTVLKSL